MAKTKKKTDARKATEIDVQIGLAIRTARLNANMSQEQLADIIGVTFQQVQKYEKGVNRVAAPTLIKIARALHREPGELLPKSDTHVKSAAPEDAAFNLEFATAVAALNTEGRKALLKIAKSFGGDPDYSRKNRQ